MIDIGLYNQYTKNIATALGIGYVLAVDDEQVTAQIPDSADPVLVAIIPSDDTADSLTADNMSEASTSLLFIVSPIKADTDTAEFFARHQLLTEKCKKLMMLYADAYPSLLGIKENRISIDPITGQFSGNMAGYILSFSLSNPATFYSETVPDIPGIDQPTAYVEIADVIGLLEALAGKAPSMHRHATSDIELLPYILESHESRLQTVENDPNRCEDEIPAVESGERVVTKSTTGVQVTKTLLDMQIVAGTIASANWSTGQATYTGQQGQTSYDANYKYECIGTNKWIRTSLMEARLQLYLSPDIDDSLGAKTSAELDTAYPTAVIGQRVWGLLFLYEKKTTNIWKKISAVTA